MSAKRIEIATADIEVDKPQGGGGKGTDELYNVDISLDGKLCLQLQRWHFKRNGQMQEFVKAMKEILAK